MRVATNQERMIILADKIVLNQDSSQPFRESAEKHFQSGISLMHLEGVEIVPICCSTINKHTCIEKLHRISDAYFLVLDEHHYQMMGSLDYLFLTFGTNVSKKAIWNNVMEHMPYHQKRLKNAVNQFLAEQYLLEGQVKKASFCIEEIDKHPLIPDVDFAGETGRFEKNLLILKLRKLDHMQPYILAFCVFHELAHIAFQEKIEQMNAYISIYDDLPEILKSHAKRVSSLYYEEDKIGYPYEDMICDAYALSLLFEMVKEHYKEFNYEFMVDSYICAVLNLTLLDSIFRHNSKSEAWYMICWIRIILVLNMVGIHFAKKYSEYEILKRIQERMNYCRMLFKNSQEYIFEEINKARANTSKVGEEKQSGIQEQKELFEHLLDRIRAFH